MSPWAQMILMKLVDIMAAILEWQGPPPETTAAKIAELRKELEASRGPLADAETNAGK